MLLVGLDRVKHPDPVGAEASLRYDRESWVVVMMVVVVVMYDVDASYTLDRCQWLAQSVESDEWKTSFTA